VEFGEGRIGRRIQREEKMTANTGGERR